jgi:hypothetical protein
MRIKSYERVVAVLGNHGSMLAIFASNGNGQTPCFEIGSRINICIKRAKIRQIDACLFVFL